MIVKYERQVNNPSTTLSLPSLAARQAEYCEQNEMIGNRKAGILSVVDFIEFKIDQGHSKSVFKNIFLIFSNKILPSAPSPPSLVAGDTGPMSGVEENVLFLHFCHALFRL